MISTRIVKDIDDEDLEKLLPDIIKRDVPLPPFPFVKSESNGLDLRAYDNSEEDNSLTVQTNMEDISVKEECEENILLKASNHVFEEILIKEYCNEENSEISDDKKRQCPICGKIFSQGSNMKKHLKKHTGTKDFRCNICNKSFTEKFSLKYHMTSHTGKKEFECDICHQLFPNNNNLMYHLNTHIGSDDKSNDYQCNLCNKSFMGKSSYDYHINSHKGIKQFQCTTCYKTFINNGALNRHLKIHKVNDEKHICNICNKQFKYKKSLECHMKAHRGIMDFKCPKCQKSFAVKRYLYKHLKMHSLDDQTLIYNQIHTDTDSSNDNLSMEVTFVSEEECEQENKSAVSQTSNNKFEEIFIIDNQTDKIHTPIYNLTDSTNNATETNITNMQDIFVKEEHELDKNIVQDSTKNIEHIYKSSIQKLEEILIKGQRMEDNMNLNYNDQNEDCTEICEDNRQCPNCGEIFSQSDNMKTHLKYIDSGIQIFCCNLKNKSFPNNNTLKYHIRSDDNISKDQLKKTLEFHMKSHDDIKDFECSICHKSFALKKYLSKHLKMHTLDTISTNTEHTLATEEHSEEISFEHVSEETSAAINMDFEDSSNTNEKSIDEMQNKMHPMDDQSLIYNQIHTTSTDMFKDDSTIIQTINRNTEQTLVTEEQSETTSADINMDFEGSNNTNDKCIEEMQIKMHSSDGQTLNQIHTDGTGTSKNGSAIIQTINTNTEQTLVTEEQSETSANINMDFENSNNTNEKCIETSSQKFEAVKKPINDNQNEKICPIEVQKTRKKIKKKLIQCPMPTCHKKFPRKLDLYNHLKTHAFGQNLIDNPVDSTIEENDETTEILENISEPVKDNNQESNDEVQTLQKIMEIKRRAKRVQCPICKVFTSQLRIHMTIHSDIKKFQCKICNKRFRHNLTLQYHLRSHAQTKDFNCHLCNKPFKHKQSLTYHMTIHSGIKETFGCPICHKTYAKKCGLKVHMNTHNATCSKQNVEKIPCSVCDKILQRSNMKKHLKKHTEKKYYRCNLCNKSFTERFSLKYHMTTHIGKKEFECSMCQQLFPNNNKLTKHLKTHISMKTHNQQTDKNIDNSIREIDKIATKSNMEHISEDASYNNSVPNNKNISVEEHLDRNVLQISTNYCKNNQIIMESVSENKFEEIVIEEQPIQHYMDFGDCKNEIKCEEDVPVCPVDNDVNYCKNNQIIMESFSENKFEEIIIEEQPIKRNEDDENLKIPTSSAIEKKSTKGKKITTKKVKKKKIIQCPICNIFTERVNMIQHIKTHSEKQDVKCPICYKTLTGKMLLYTHLKTHTLNEQQNDILIKEEVYEKTSSEHELYKSLKIDTEYISGEGNCKFKEEQPNKNSPGSFAEKNDETILNNINCCQIDTPGTNNQKFEEILIIEEPIQDMHMESEDQNQNSRKEKRQCPICKIFVLRINMNRHLKSHNGHKDFHCHICNKVFTQKASLEYHINAHNGIKDFECSICHKSFAKSSTLKTHLQIHTRLNENNHEFEDNSQNNKYSLHERQCPVCAQIFVFPSSMRNHLKKHTGDVDYHCYLCNMSFKHIPSFKKHLASHNKDCSISHKWVAKESVLETHLYIQTPKNPDTTKEEDQPGEDMIQHIKTHTTNKDYHCNLCNKQFKDRSGLRYHKNHTHIDKKEFKCDICHQLFPNNNKLKYHMKKHIGNDENKSKYFHCSLCNKSFTQKASLQYHMKVHDGIKDFECTICYKAFAKKSILKNHLNMHISTLTCTICKQLFPEINCLKDHLLSHMLTPGRSF